MPVLRLNTEGNKTIAFDFDGVLSFTSLVFPEVQSLSYSHYYLVRFLHKEGWDVYIHTARKEIFPSLYRLPILEVEMLLSACSIAESKPDVALFVDDRAVGSDVGVTTIISEIEDRVEKNFKPRFDAWLREEGFVPAHAGSFRNSWYNSLEEFLLIPYGSQHFKVYVDSSEESEGYLRSGEFKVEWENNRMHIIHSTGKHLWEILGLSKEPLNPYYHSDEPTNNRVIAIPPALPLVLSGDSRESYQVYLDQAKGMIL